MKKFLFLIAILIFNCFKAADADMVKTPVETPACAETGIRILKDHKVVYIIDVIKGSPAEKSGILAGTRLYKIDNKNIAKFSPIEIINLLYGQENSKVTLQVKAYNKKEKITLVRKVLSKDNTLSAEFMKYWSQVAPPYFYDKEYLISNEEYPRNIKRYVFANNYWVDRRINFESSYKSCSQSANKTGCVNQLVQQEKAIKNNPKGRE